MTHNGLFVGLVTLDLIYLVQQMPHANQKMVALDYQMAAGGPATNAAVTFQYLGNEATLLGVLGCHPLSRSIAAELDHWGVTIADLKPNHSEPPPTSSIWVTQATGERAVVSLNALRSQVSAAVLPQVLGWEREPELDGSELDIVLIDGHQMAVGEAIAQWAKQRNIPIVIDAGSWKPGLAAVLTQADYVICSANFHPPGCASIPETLAYLQQLGVPHMAITAGETPIQGYSQGDRFQVVVPKIQPVDTLGAGDIFHGAFCHFILQSDFAGALAQAAQVASRACESFGTRGWMG